MTYYRTVKAALAETKSKFELAEALALDIPRRGTRSSSDRHAVLEELAAAREKIILAGGEPRSVDTLDRYRRTALWVYLDVEGVFRWVPGSSFSSHSEACEVGMSYDDFATKPQTARQIRKSHERQGKDGPPEKVAQSWTPEQRASVARELLADPEVAEEIAEDITEHVASDPRRTADVVSRRRDAMPVPEHQIDPEPVRPQRDYDYLIEQHVNGLSVALAAESSGKFVPSDKSEALLYFLTQILGNRREPTGEQASFVNEKLDNLFAEVEAYANAEAS